MFSSAAAYEWFTGRWSARLARAFADFLPVRADGRTLDVGCGTGVMAQAMADRYPRMSIVGIDPVENFLDYARARMPGTRVTFDRGSVLALPYADHAFDQSVSLLVFHLLPDPERGALEMRRVTRPGGVVAACTWDVVGNQRIQVFWEEQVRLDSASETQAERPRHCNRRGELSLLWQDTGLTNVTETALEIRTEFQSFDDYWLPFLEGVGPTGMFVAALTPERRDAIREALRRRLLGGHANGTIILAGQAWAVRGTVPR